MKVCCISDTHTMHEKIAIPECDLLIHSGDACGQGTLGEISTFAQWLERQVQAKHIIYVPGNHDRAVQTFPDLVRSMFHRAVVLIDDLVTIDGIRIYGTPYTPAFCNWAFQGVDHGSRSYNHTTDPELDRIYKKIPQCEILVCHGPFQGVLDKTWEGDHVGSVSMRKRLTEMSRLPKLYVCGHIHQSRGIAENVFDHMTVVNAASVDDDYEVLPPIMVDV